MTLCSNYVIGSRHRERLLKILLWSSGRRFADWRAELAWLSGPCRVQKTGGWLSKLARLFGIETAAQERRDIGGFTVGFSQ